MDNQKFQVLPNSVIRQGVLDSIEEYFSNKFEEYQTKQIETIHHKTIYLKNSNKVLLSFGYPFAFFYKVF